MLFIYFIFILQFYYSTCYLSCRDENNNEVDWFVGLKYPNSYEYVYYKSSQTNDKWQIPIYNLKDPQNVIGKTIQQAYEAKKNDSFFIFYNDQYPDGKDVGYRGHLKGVLNCDKRSGYWLIHSIPHFPRKKRYRYSKNETIYGQSFICISFKANYLKEIVEQLLMMQSSVFYYNLPSDLFVNNPSLQHQLIKLVNNKRYSGNINQTLQLNTDSIKAVHFGKSKYFGHDLYDSLVAPGLKTSLYVESWIRGYKVNSSCDNKYKVYNVEATLLLKRKFTETQDHSKWAVGEDHETICIGDINRMTSQFKRGGGTLCIKDKTIWRLFDEAINEIEACPKSIL